VATDDAGGDQAAGQPSDQAAKNADAAEGGKDSGAEPRSASEKADAGVAASGEEEGDETATAAVTPESAQICGDNPTSAECVQASCADRADPTTCVQAVSASPCLTSPTGSACQSFLAARRDECRGDALLSQTCDEYIALAGGPGSPYCVIRGASGDDLDTDPECGGGGGSEEGVGPGSTDDNATTDTGGGEPFGVSDPGALGDRTPIVARAATPDRSTGAPAPDLASTGFELAWLVVVGLLLLAGGLVLARYTRRRPLT
jgi:LPXTG-motif cell wall-anchored protein